jgi:anaerobic ribonucleoside-triphosphate reductase activating protein
MIRISSIKTTSHVDGPGKRTVLFVQGCPIECPGCQNKALWPSFGGHMENENDVAQSLADLAVSHGNITISGGDPFAQRLALSKLVKRLREFKTVKHIIVYTGYLYEDLIQNPLCREILKHVDVLVDGPFIRSQDDLLLTYRGSRNQRPINIPTSLSAGRIVTLDWDSPEIIISTDGNALMPVGLIPQFSGLGNVQPTRRCGETSSRA